MIRVVLDERDFRDLIAGKVIKKDGVEIALQDIGYHVMARALKDEIES